MENTMLKKILIAAAALGFSGAALAHPPEWAPAYGWRAHHYRPHYYVAPRQVYVVPAPRVVYAPPPPVVYPYYAAPGFSVRFSFPL